MTTIPSEPQKEEGVGTVHTPEPWCLLSFEADKDYLRIRGARLGARYKIANVMRPSHGLSGEHEESEANARLISAAPELLAACKVAFDQTCSVGRSKDWEQLRAAIAKATGSSNHG